MIDYRVSYEMRRFLTATKDMEGNVVPYEGLGLPYHMCLIFDRNMDAWSAGYVSDEGFMVRFFAKEMSEAVRLLMEWGEERGLIKKIKSGRF